MSFRAKLFIIVGLIITVSVILSSAITYIFAKRQLEMAARKEMQQTVALIAKQSQIALDTIKVDMEMLAELRLIGAPSRSPRNRTLVDETNRYLKMFVEKNEFYQSINLLNRDALCIASSDTDRIGHVTMQRFVNVQHDFKAAAAGKTCVSQIILSMGTGRPSIAVSVPVKRNGAVTAVIRAILDLDHLNDFFLKPQEFIYGGKAHFYDPALDTTLPKGWKIPNIIKAKPYVKPSIPLLPELMTKKHGFIRYASEKGLQIAAFCRTSNPEFLFIIERPLKDVFSPIHTMGEVTLIMLVIVLLAISASVFLIANPFLLRLQQCMAFAREIKGGFLDKRLNIEGNDEIAQLGKGLNAMAKSLEKNRKALEDAEQMYRGIFENAVEGIFITDHNGFLLNANQAFASIIGFDSPAQMIGSNVTQYYSSDRRSVLLDLLKSRGTVKYFEVCFHRLDGTERIGSIYARADKDKNGEILQVQGILDDITEIRKIEEQRRRAEEAELRSARSQLEALRYQINPHFLFNVLNSLDTLSENDPGRIHSLIEHLSRYLRSTFSISDSGLVPLREELRTLESYLHLQKIRFEDKLDVTFDASPRALDILVPELLLQPIVENSVKHGMITTKLPLRIVINGRTDDGLLRIEIANTGKLVSRENNNNNGAGVGLENIRKRLELTYPGNHRLNVGEDNGWVRVIIEVPLKGEENEKQT